MVLISSECQKDSMIKYLPGPETQMFCSWCWSTKTRTLMLGEEWAPGTQDKELLPFSCQPRVWLSNAGLVTKETEA